LIRRFNARGVLVATDFAPIVHSRGAVAQNANAFEQLPIGGRRFLIVA
jgi:hypothetical protein